MLTFRQQLPSLELDLQASDPDQTRYAKLHHHNTPLQAECSHVLLSVMQVSPKKVNQLKIIKNYLCLINKLIVLTINWPLDFLLLAAPLIRSEQLQLCVLFISSTVFNSNKQIPCIQLGWLPTVLLTNFKFYSKFPYALYQGYIEYKTLWHS